ncbi:MAG: hypothetical protein J6M22_00180 [Firmicutes bacterium]|nr:hypothetical protein [Bacillota bacterium]
MEFTSAALAGLAKTGGPRCCKRDAYISFETAVRHINENYDVELKISDVRCGFSEKNAQCIKDRCPYFPRPKVAFICVHNSCRSQIAEALGKKYLSDICDCYSAGTETKPQINQDAVRLMKELYGIDMEATQHSKLASGIPAPDIAISMGCNVTCPYVVRPFNDDWGLEDPTGQSDEKFLEIIKMIEEKVLELRNTVLK